MIQIDNEPCAVIKHYKVKVTLHTTYDVFLIHNETTGEIKMTSFGMSMNSYDRCVDDVISMFKEQRGLGVDGKVKVGAV